MITNHNYARYLREALNSALAQTHGPTEVIVVDDGSSDGSREILTEYGDCVRTLVQESRGQTSAMNAGLAVARGDVILFVDADDALEPRAIDEAVVAFERSPVIKTHWPAVIVDATGVATGTRLPATTLPRGNLRAEASASGPLGFAFPPTSANAWRRSFLDEVFPLPEFERELGVGSASADALLSMLALFGGEIEALPSALTRYRVHGVNDYAGTDFGHRVRRHVRVIDLQLPIIARYCRTQGLEVDVEAWRDASWFHRVATVAQRIEATVPPGSTALLLDGGEWGGSLVQGRNLRPFPERDGVWWGVPASDEEAVDELERAVHPSVTHVIVAWQCAWWLDAFPLFAAALRARANAIHVDADATIVTINPQ